MASASVNDEKDTSKISVTKCLYCDGSHPDVSLASLRGMLNRDDWEGVAHVYCIFMQKQQKIGLENFLSLLSQVFSRGFVAVARQAITGETRPVDGESQTAIDELCAKLRADAVGGDGKTVPLTQRPLHFGYDTSANWKAYKPRRRVMTLLLFAAAFSDHPTFFDDLVNYTDAPLFPELYSIRGRQMRGGALHAVLACSGFIPKQSMRDRCALIQRRCETLLSPERKLECDSMQSIGYFEQLVESYGKLNPGFDDAAPDAVAVTVVKMRRASGISKFASRLEFYTEWMGMQYDPRLLRLILQHIHAHKNDSEVHTLTKRLCLLVGILSRYGDPKFRNLEGRQRERCRNQLSTCLAVFKSVGLHTPGYGHGGTTIAATVERELNEAKSIAPNKWSRWWSSQCTVDQAAVLLHNADRDAAGNVTNQTPLDRVNAERSLVRNIADYLGTG